MAPGAESRTIPGWKLDALGHLPTRGHAGSRYREYCRIPFLRIPQNTLREVTISLPLKKKNSLLNA